MSHYGKPVRGVLHSTDASTAVQIPLYLYGETGDVYTLEADEFICIHKIDMVTEPGGDVWVFGGADNNPSSGETVKRGTFAANGGISNEAYFGGEVGHNIFVQAPAGVVDVVFEASIHKNRADNIGGRPSWRESSNGT